MMSTHESSSTERTSLFRPDSSTDHGSIQSVPASAAWDNKQVDLAVTSDKESATFRGEVRATLDDKASLAIVLFDVLLVDTARGIFFPTLWANIKQLGGDKIALGYCVGAFSLGRTLMSPVFGRMSTKHGYRRVLMISSALVVFGALFYAVVNSVFGVFLSQVFLGVGSGTLGVTRGYVADKTTPAQRTYLLAYTTAVQYAGFTVMPVVGGLFSYVLGSAKIPLVGRFMMLTQFTAPAFFVAAMAGAVFVLLWSVFQDGIRNQPPAEKTPSAKDLPGAPSGVSLVPTVATEAGSSDDGDGDGDGDSGDDSRSVVGQYVEISSDGDGDIRRSTTSVGSGSGAGEDGAMEDLEGGYQAGAGAAGSAAGEGEEKDRGEEAALFEGGAEEGWLARNLRLRLPSRGDMLIYGGFLLNISTKGTISCFETIGAEYAMTNFSLTSAEAGSLFATCGAIGVASLLCMRLLCRHFNDIQLVLGGMTLMIVTCGALAFPIQAGPAGVHLFVVAVFLMYAIGYPIGHTAVLGLFSKVVGAQPQGTLMGWFGSAGALARTFFPVVAGVLSQELGSSALFVFLVAILSVTFALLFTFRKPYLECVEITNRRKAAVAPAGPSSGTTTSAAR